MTFVSENRGWPRFDDSTNPIVQQEQYDDGLGAGYIPRDYDLDPQASDPAASFCRAPIIPRDEWKERIEERERKKQRGLDLIETFNIPLLHQGRTSSCWAQSVIQGMHFQMARDGGPVIPLSPAFVSALIKNFRDVGGNCSEACKWINKRGACNQKLWPPNANTSRQYNTEESNADAERHRILEWDDLTPRSFDETVSELLAGFFPAYGNYDMSHAVLAIDPIIDERGDVGLLVANSGLYRGPNGLNTFFGRYTRPDDAIAIRSITIDATVPN